MFYMSFQVPDPVTGYTHHIEYPLSGGWARIYTYSGDCCINNTWRRIVMEGKINWSYGPIYEDVIRQTEISPEAMKQIDSMVSRVFKMKALW